MSCGILHILICCLCNRFCLGCGFSVFLSFFFFFFLCLFLLQLLVLVPEGSHPLPAILSFIPVMWWSQSCGEIVFIQNCIYICVIFDSYELCMGLRNESCSSGHCLSVFHSQGCRFSVFFRCFWPDPFSADLFPVFRYSLFSPISSFSFWTFCLFLCSFSVRRHAHIDFQLFLQKSSGIPAFRKLHVGRYRQTFQPSCLIPVRLRLKVIRSVQSKTGLLHFLALCTMDQDKTCSVGEAI